MATYRPSILSSRAQMAHPHLRYSTHPPAPTPSAPQYPPISCSLSWSIALKVFHPKDLDSPCPGRKRSLRLRPWFSVCWWMRAWWGKEILLWYPIFLSLCFPVSFSPIRLLLLLLLLTSIGLFFYLYTQIDVKANDMIFVNANTHLRVFGYRDEHLAASQR